MTRKTKPKLFFGSALALGALIATSCSGSETESTSADSFEGQTLTVANWKDYGTISVGQLNNLSLKQVRKLFINTSTL